MKGWVRKGTETGQGIRLASLNIHTGRVGILEMALWALQEGDMNVGFLQEVKMNQGIHIRNGAWYDVWVTEVESWY